jgi:hypothetical protein
VDNMNDRLESHGYINVKGLEQAKDLLQSGFYVLVGGKEIMNTIASFYLEGKIIEVEVFDPSNMTRERYKTSILGFEAAFALAIKNRMPVYAKKKTAESHPNSRRPKDMALIEIRTVEGVFEYLNGNKSIVLSCDNVTFFITKVDDLVMMCDADSHNAKPMCISHFREMAKGIINLGGFFLFDPCMHTTAMKIEIRPETEAGNETSS